MDAKEEKHLIRLESGYSVNTVESPDGDWLTVNAPDGRICLKMILTPDGPAIELHGVSLKLNAQKDVRLKCESLEIHAGKEMILRTGGDLTHIAEKNINVKAGGALQTEAFSQKLRARSGDFEVKAKDDVMIDGERVRLNSPHQPAELKRNEDSK
jgi:hypothetical protein